MWGFTILACKSGFGSQPVGFTLTFSTAQPKGPPKYRSTDYKTKTLFPSIREQSSTLFQLKPSSKFITQWTSYFLTCSWQQFQNTFLDHISPLCYNREEFNCWSSITPWMLTVLVFLPPSCSRENMQLPAELVLAGDLALRTVTYFLLVFGLYLLPHRQFSSSFYQWPAVAFSFHLYTGY